MYAKPCAIATPIVCQRGQGQWFGVSKGVLKDGGCTYQAKLALLTAGQCSCTVPPFSAERLGCVFLYSPPVA